MCCYFNINFTSKMLKWPKGERRTDGVWSPYWYKNVINSNSFFPYKNSREEVSPQYKNLLNECLSYYDYLLVGQTEGRSVGRTICRSVGQTVGRSVCRSEGRSVCTVGRFVDWMDTESKHQNQERWSEKATSTTLKRKISIKYIEAKNRKQKHECEHIKIKNIETEHQNSKH